MPMVKKTKSKGARSQPPQKHSRNGQRPTSSIPQQRNDTIPDYRLEKPDIELRQVQDGDVVRYEVSGNLDGPVPPVRDS